MAHSPPAPPTYVVASPPVSGMAVAALVLGVVGVVGGWCTFAVPCLLAVVFGAVGLGQTRDGARSGRGMAIAGLVLGLVPTAVIAVILVLGGIGALMAPLSAVSSQVTEKTATTAPSAPPGKGLVVMQDEALTVNLADGHYLKLKMALQLAAGQSDQLDMSTAISLAVDKYTGMAISDLATERGREAAKQDLVEQVRTAYQGAVVDIYYTQFVTQ